MADKSDQPKAVSLQELQQTVASKKKEAKAIKAQSEALAAENNVPVEVEPDALPQGEKMLAVIGYFSFFCILPLLVKPQSAFCQFHGKQGLILTLFFLVLGGVISFVLGLFTAPYLAHNLVMLLYVVFACMGMYWAFHGHTRKLPLFGDFVSKLDW